MEALAAEHAEKGSNLHLCVLCDLCGFVGSVGLFILGAQSDGSGEYELTFAPDFATAEGWRGVRNQPPKGKMFLK